MRAHQEHEFLAWAERSGFHIDARYPESAVLTFHPDSEHDRFWEVPVQPERRPYLIASLLECMGDWQACYAWRHLGSWPQSALPERINDVVELRMLRGLGLSFTSASESKTASTTASRRWSDEGSRCLMKSRTRRSSTQVG
jgi:hypothetical protein